MSDPKSNVTAIQSMTRDRDPAQVLRDALSHIEAEAANGVDLGVIVITTHPDPSIWPSTNWATDTKGLVVGAAVLQAQVQETITAFGASRFEGEDDD